jgi:hypothetical protein
MCGEAKGLHKKIRVYLFLCTFCKIKKIIKALTFWIPLTDVQSKDTTWTEVMDMKLNDKNRHGRNFYTTQGPHKRSWDKKTKKIMHTVYVATV